MVSFLVVWNGLPHDLWTTDISRRTFRNGGKLVLYAQQTYVGVGLELVGLGLGLEVGLGL